MSIICILDFCDLSKLFNLLKALVKTMPQIFYLQINKIKIWFQNKKNVLIKFFSCFCDQSDFLHFFFKKTKIVPSCCIYHYLASKTTTLWACTIKLFTLVICPVMQWDKLECLSLSSLQPKSNIWSQAYPSVAPLETARNILDKGRTTAVKSFAVQSPHHEPVLL